MKSTDFNQLIDSIKEAGEIRRGEKKASRSFEFKAEDIKKVRKNLNKSQDEFALMIGVSVATLRNWEQGRRVPRGPAQALLKVTSKNPKAVIEALST